MMVAAGAVPVLPPHPVLRPDPAVLFLDLVPAEMGLADKAGLVPRLVKILRQPLAAGGEEIPVALHAMLVGIKAGLDGGAVGRADRGGRDAVGELQPLPAEPVDHGGGYVGVAVAAQPGPAQLVGQDKQDVGAFCLLFFHLPDSFFGV